MVHNGGSPEEEVWSDMGPHEEFRELCAVATSGELTEGEKTKLKEHLSVCPECREALKDFQSTADLGASLFAADDSSPLPERSNGWSVETAEATFQKRLAKTGSGAIGEDVEAQNGKPHLSENWNHVWLPFAAAILLAATLGIYAYKSGERHGTETALSIREPKIEKPAVNLPQEISDAGHDRQIVAAQIAERDKVIGDLRRQLEQQAAEIEKLKEAQTALQSASKASDDEKSRLAGNQATLSQKLEIAQSTLDKTRKELDAALAERSHDDAGSKSLQARIGDLTQLLKERETTIDEQQELLAHDRDIRELMGARDLYIAEVIDVAKTGATQKPYGRVFFTKGKSLIFYAYDLDKRSGWKNASAFQVWGQRGLDREQALNLGIFFEDNVSKKRWILKSDDPQKLNQIDAVFVTVEPNGGSQKPTGKPFLYAYLKVAPNHP
jgi:hypothetical protein